MKNTGCLSGSECTRNTTSFTTHRQLSSCCLINAVDPVVHSYTSSKHGIIMQLEKNSYDWQQPLSMANYRSPGCNYCHLHEADHNVNNMTRNTLMDENTTDAIEIRIRSRP